MNLIDRMEAFWLANPLVPDELKHALHRDIRGLASAARAGMAISKWDAEQPTPAIPSNLMTSLDVALAKLCLDDCGADTPTAKSLGAAGAANVEEIKRARAVADAAFGFGPDTPADDEPCSCCDGEGCAYCTPADSQEDKT